MKHGKQWSAVLAAWAVVGLCAVRALAGAPRPASCEKTVLTGEVAAGQEWKTSIGAGWVLRVMPIQPANAGYSGWDLVVDRDPPAGFPDALFLAMPPYGSINEREVGKTFGVRAQDAIGWNPRSFHFLTDAKAFDQARKLYQTMEDQGMTGIEMPRPNEAIARKLMELASQSKAAGQFRILDARITPGTADAAPFAEAWAMQSAKTPHTNGTSDGNARDGKASPSPMGTLNWIRFSIALWMPDTWKAPMELHAVRGACSE